RPPGPDQRADRRGSPARGAGRAGRSPGARHLSAGGGGLLNPAADPLAALEREALRPYYLLFGGETFLVERALGVLRRRLLPEGRPGTWRSLWAGEDAHLGEALAALRSPPLFGGPQ